MWSPSPSSARLDEASDLILPETRWLALLILPFLIGGFFLLYPLPAETSWLFAWPMASPMTAMTLASAYVGGIYYFVGVLRASRWHHVKVGMLPVTAFASILGVATLWHWDQFNHWTLWFPTWAGLYFTAPFAVAFAWQRNRGADSGNADVRDAVIPALARVAVAVIGATALVVAAGLLARPEAMANAWPWAITPLDARVIGAMFALPGVAGLGMSLDARWSSARLILQAQACSLACILVGVARGWGEFSTTNPTSYLFAGALTALLGGTLVVYLVMERRIR